MTANRSKVAKRFIVFLLESGDSSHLLKGRFSVPRSSPFRRSEVLSDELRQNG
jgi:hypothetical protein